MKISITPIAVEIKKTRFCIELLKINEKSFGFSLNKRDDITEEKIILNIFFYGLMKSFTLKTILCSTYYICSFCRTPLNRKTFFCSKCCDHCDINGGETIKVFRNKDEYDKYKSEIDECYYDQIELIE